MSTEMTDITWLMEQQINSVRALKAFAPLTYALVLIVHGDPSLAGLLAMYAHSVAWVFNRLVVTEITDRLRESGGRLLVGSSEITIVKPESKEKEKP